MAKKVLLYSGGMDSWLIEKIWQPDISLYINVNGSYSDYEIANLPGGVEVIEFPLGKYEVGENRYIPMRNLYFLMLATNYGNDIVLGATAGDLNAKDKTPEFFSMAEEFINYLITNPTVNDHRKVTINQRFVNMSKDDLVKEYLAMGGDINELASESFSCFYPNEEGKECLNCKPCFRKFVSLYNNGYSYTAKEKLAMLDYMEREVVKRDTVTGTYYKERNAEGENMETAIERLFSEFHKDLSKYES